MLAAAVADGCPPIKPLLDRLVASGAAAILLASS